MVWKAGRPVLVACESSLIPDRGRIKDKRRTSYLCLRLGLWSIINFLVIASVAVVEMAEGAAPTVRPHNSTTSKSTTITTNATQRGTADLNTLCPNATSNLTSLDYTLYSQLLEDQVPTCNALTWGRLLPSTINCTLIFDVLKKLLLIEEQFLKFKSALERYDCRPVYKYSTKMNCSDCLISYNSWLCSAQLNLNINGTRVKPCLDDCYRVIRSCPSFLPDDENSHGGHSTFDCPSYGDVSKNLTNYSEQSNCQRIV